MRLSPAQCSQLGAIWSSNGGPRLEQRQKVSIVVPVRNQADNVHSVYQELNAACRNLACQFQFLFVDDGSTDHTERELARLNRRDGRVEYVVLMRPFGFLSAIEAGAAHATGEAVVVWDAAASFPVTLVSEMIAKWQSGVDVVHVGFRGGPAGGRQKRRACSISGAWSALFRNSSSNEESRAVRLVSQDVIRRLRRQPAERWVRGGTSLAGVRQAEVISANAPVRRTANEAEAATDRDTSGRSQETPAGFILRTVVLLSLLTGAAGALGGLATLMTALVIDSLAGPVTWLLACVLFLGGVQLAATSAIALSVLNVYSRVGVPRYALRRAVVPSLQNGVHSLN